MHKLKKWMITTALCCISTVALADWESASMVDEVSAGGDYYKCIYETTGGFRFSITRKGLCPYSVEINEETGQVRQR